MSFLSFNFLPFFLSFQKWAFVVAQPAMWVYFKKKLGFYIYGIFATRHMFAPWVTYDNTGMELIKMTRKMKPPPLIRQT